MNQKYFKFLIVILVVAIVVPTIVSAAWWNPFSWGVWNRIFHFQQTEQQKNSISDYIFSNLLANTVKVELSHHGISFNSPWGKEKDVFCGKITTYNTGMCAYTFQNGLKMGISVESEKPKNIMDKKSSANKKTVEDLSVDELNFYQNIFRFAYDKIGHDFNYCEYWEFISSTTEKMMNEAANSKDKEGYRLILESKASSFFSNNYDVYKFKNNNGVGMMALIKNSGSMNYLIFCGSDDKMYSFAPHDLNSKEDISAFVKSLATVNK